MSFAISQLLEIQTTACGYVYNREFITRQIQILNLTEKKIMFLVVLSKLFLVSIISVTFNLDACKVSFLKYL